jgi:membrane protein
MAQSTRPPEKLPSVFSLALRLGKGLRAHNSFTTAAAMAFNFFLSFIPLLILAGFALGQLVRRRGIEALMEPFLDALPAAAAQLVRQQLVGLAGSGSAPVAPLSVIGFLMVASTGTHHLMDVFEVAVGATRRAWWKQRAFALAWLMSMMGVLSIAAWALLSADSALHRGEHVPERAHIAASGASVPLSGPPPPTSTRSKGKAESTTTVVTKAVPFKHRPFLIKHALWEKAVVVGTMLAILLTGLAVLYRFAVKHPAGVVRRAWPGAALALGAGFIVSYAFGIYAATLASYTDYYGSLAAVAVVLVWLYLTSLSLLLGAELNAQLEGVRVL